jgi:uncharacterized membrane protein YvbJ
MALIPCEECGAQISERAWKCPQCGMPNTQMKHLHPRFYGENGDLKILKVLMIVPYFFILLFGILFVVGWIDWWISGL